jgi:hypothetical protein
MASLRKMAVQTVVLTGFAPDSLPSTTWRSKKRGTPHQFESRPRVKILVAVVILNEGRNNRRALRQGFARTPKVA